MHTLIRYSGTRRARRLSANRDCKAWLGDERYNAIQDAFRADLRKNPSRRRIRYLENMLCLSGIEGYPARAFTLIAFKHRND